MKSLIFVLILLYNSIIFSFDRFLDINLTTDFSNLKGKSHVDFNSQAVVPFSDRAFLLNPRVSVFFDGSMDVSFATGLRHQTRFGTLGHYLFWDSTGIKDAHFHQIGHSLDLSTERLDYRINYYHPITKEQLSKNFLLSPHKWVEGEIVYKFPILQVGCGPRYNIFDKLWGVQAKAVIPFKYFNIGSLVSYDKKNGCSGAISLSFRLYGTPRKSAMEAPIQHQSRVQYSKEVVFIPPPPENKKRVIHKEEIKEPEPEQKPPAVSDSNPDSTINDLPAEVFPPPKKGWIFFFREELTPM